MERTIWTEEKDKYTQEARGKNVNDAKAVVRKRTKTILESGIQ